jgi:glutamate dehydrogenase
MTTMKTARRSSHEDALAQSIKPYLTKGALPGEIDGFGSKAATEASAFLAALCANWSGTSPALTIETVRRDPKNAQSQPYTRFGIINDDSPFLVDSTAAALTAHGLSIRRLLHPVIRAERKASRKIGKLGRARGARDLALSFIYIETDAVDSAAQTALAEELRSVLSMVHAAVSSWHEVQAAMRVDAAAIADEEGAELLRWFVGGQMTMLGHCLFKRGGSIAEPLGIARLMGDTLLSKAARKRAFDWFAGGGAQPLIIKSNQLSPIHRRVPIELVITPRVEKGRVTALSAHAGLWTSAALRTPPAETPVLRQRVSALQAQFGFDPTGHAGKALNHALTALPHDVLISVDMPALAALAQTAMSVIDRPRPALSIASSPLARHLVAFVWLPRDELNTARRIAIADHLQAEASAALLSWSVDLDDSGTALIRYTLDIRDGGSVPDAEPLNVWLEGFLRGWQPAVEALLDARVGPEEAARLAATYAKAMPQAYRDSDGAGQAADDILCIARLGPDTPHIARFFAEADGALHLKLYAAHPIDLSAAVPVLENFGFRVLSEDPTEIGSAALIHDFTLSVGDSAEAASELLRRSKPVETAIAGVLHGTLENDRFNALMVAVGLDERAVVLFRALFRYLRQTGMSYGLITVVDALRNAAAITLALTRLFASLHDPAARKGARKASEQAQADIAVGLTAITALDDDRILRLYRSVILGCLRTNMYAPQEKEALAFKLDSATIPGLPDPKPWREIFVYAPRVEGIHLRAGPIARGGLRWSDRRDDFRTEVLGLMKAQRVKNAVIVPTGAKGGFYPKQLPDPANREAWAEEGKESYRIFIRTLLSVTDNLVAGKLVHPEMVVIRDGEDPYFVVAADKGTASFSDVANAIALERGFWLGDAFASGGSQGYDHKAMGITAKGAWVSARRHFSEMGVDLQTDPVRAAGCGDMSGDVFGNGMLLSKSIKLVAAFDHRHIFFDPDPDPTQSWEERARLFALPRSSWADYNAKLISRGGGIFPRTSKTITLTPEVQALLACGAADMEPSQIIAAILKAPVDLMWFGGIGTYVKASNQGNADVGDRANDAHRISANALRAKVIGEGANLGLTQEARIEFALRGGRINTDFIDNSAGVDCSDNEVNIKIALNSEVLAGRLSEPARNKLLARMTDDVAALVLEDNRLQTLALSIAEREGAAGLPAQLRLVEMLEAAGKLDRAVEGIAANDELSRRAADGKGLTRPELAVIMATAKLLLQDAVEGSGLESDGATLHDLLHAFPGEMQKKFRPAIEEHRLRGAIIATKIANRIINRMGLTYPFELAEEEGCRLDDVAEAFVIAEQVYDIPALWDAIDTSPMNEATRLMLYDQVAIEMRAHMADILRNAVDGRSNDKAIAAYRPAVEKLSDARDQLLPKEAKRQTQAFADRLMAASTPPEIAERIVRLAQLDGAIGLAALATRSKADVTVLTRAFSALGEALGLDWAQGTAMQLDPSDPWERLLAASLSRDFQTMRLSFLAERDGRRAVEAVTGWLKTNAPRVEAFQKVIERAKGAHPTTAMLAQIAGQARILLSR